MIKHTDKDHPDYDNIKICLDEFQKINNDNNQNMEKYNLLVNLDS